MTNVNKFIDEDKAPVIIDATYSDKDIIRKSITISALNNTLVSAETDKYIKLIGLLLVASEEVSLQFKSDSTEMTGPIILDAKGAGLMLPPVPSAPYISTKVGEALNVTLSSGIAVGGFILYYIDEE